MVTIYFIRHAETPYNASQSHVGGRSPQLPLSVDGLVQAQEAAKWMRQQNFDFTHVFCSSAVRARLTLAPIIKACELPSDIVTYSDELSEVSQGEWEGHPRSEILTPEILKRIADEAPYFKAPGGESHIEATERMMNFVKREILDKHETGKFLLVGHGLSFKCLLEGILGINPKMTYKIAIGNVSLTRMRYEDARGWFIDYINRKIIP